MLSDRSYMRDDDYRGRTSLLTWLLCAMAAGFILQTLFTQLLTPQQAPVEIWLKERVPYLAGGHAWCAIALWLAHLVTYGFVHANLLHLLVTGVATYFFGRELLPLMGPRGFGALFFGSLAVGGLLWTGLHAFHPGSVASVEGLLGAGPAVSGMLALFALLFPDQEITIFLFFIPVTVKPKYVAITALAIELFGCIFYEAPGGLAPFSLAPSAQLGGMAAGWLYWRYVHEASWRRGSGRPAIELPKWIKRSPPGSTPAASYQVNVGNREHLKAEVDRILDKINSQGFGALTADEKRLLDEAKDLLSRR